MLVLRSRSRRVEMSPVLPKEFHSATSQSVVSH